MAKNRRVSGKPPAPSPRKSREPAESEVRERQGAIAKILEGLFGPMDAANTDTWCRRTHLQLVGMMFARLASDEEGMPTADLVRYSKMLIEQLRIDKGEEAPKSQGKPKPESLGEAVRTLYGTGVDAKE